MNRDLEVRPLFVEGATAGGWMGGECRDEAPKVKKSLKNSPGSAPQHGKLAVVESWM
jgi:hypothetical protein